MEPYDISHHFNGGTIDILINYIHQHRRNAYPLTKVENVYEGSTPEESNAVAVFRDIRKHKTIKRAYLMTRLSDACHTIKKSILRLNTENGYKDENHHAMTNLSVLLCDMMERATVVAILQEKLNPPPVDKFIREGTLEEIFDHEGRQWLYGRQIKILDGSLKGQTGMFLYRSGTVGYVHIDNFNEKRAVSIKRHVGVY